VAWCFAADLSPGSRQRGGFTGFFGAFFGFFGVFLGERGFSVFGKVAAEALEVVASSGGCLGADLLAKLFGGWVMLVVVQ